jgi:mRNA interferase RelE/StbE
MASDRQERYAIFLEHQAEKALRRLPRDLLVRVDRLILALAVDPRPAGCKKLKGYDNLYRVRLGDWRIVYAVEDDRLVVLLIEVASRGEAYRDL